MHGHVDAGPVLGLFLWESVWAVGGCEASAVWVSLSRAQCLCERVENIRRLRRVSAGGVDCKSEQHLLPGLRRVVWGQQHQISHRSYLLHSSQRQFVLAADRTRERERKNRLFIWETGECFYHEQCLCIFLSSGSSERDQSLTLALRPCWNHNCNRMIF